ncbi:hypothetical protein [uncultured Proteiniphilum sp.]|uniref:hypothetical protein n=1 Tax=uncultured Proteiniphilum sp. TaxID=497637 RepID=UPI0026063642|nr:hypothetical protein [uncultured Proteiniphilum sp.]
MKNTGKTYKAIGLLKRHYYGNIILLAVVFLLILFRIVPLFTDGQSIGVTTERYAIMITLIAIPVSLKFFAYRLKRLSRPLGIMTATEKYKNASFLRLYSISTVTLMHVLLFGISRNMNFFWFTVVLFLVFLYCRPSYEELESLTEIPTEKKPDEEQPSFPNRNQTYGEQDLPKEEQKQPEEVQNNYPENEQVAGK